MRTRTERRRDSERRLAHDVDLWVATASADGVPYLVPLSFDWDGEALLIATPANSPTGRNLATTPTVRLGLGQTRDDRAVKRLADTLPFALPFDEHARRPAYVRGESCQPASRSCGSRTR